MSRADCDAIIIGGGPAGLAAGMHLARAGYEARLFESGRLGGQARLLGKIENYPGFPWGIGGRELMERWVRQALRWGLRARRARVCGVSRWNGGFKVRTSKGRVFKTRSVLCCMGGKFKSLSVPGEERLLGRGVYHGAFEEMPKFCGKVVAVAGGGEAAVHQAIGLSRHARSVYLIHRGDRLKAHRFLRERLSLRPNVFCVFGTEIRTLEGERKLRRVWVRDLKAGTCRPLAADALFVLIGKEAASLPRLGRRRPAGLFLAGDADGSAFRQVAVAGGEGIKAAMECIRYLEGLDA